MIKKLLSLILLCAVASTASAGTKELNFVKQINQEINYAETHQVNVWPGFHPASKPFIIGFENDSGKHNQTAYALNFKPGSLPWVDAGIGASSYYLADADDLGLDEMTPGIGGFVNIDGSYSYTDNLTKDFLSIENMSSTVMQNRAIKFLTEESTIDKKNLSNTMNANYDSFTSLETIKLVFLEDAVLNKSQASSNPKEAEKALRDAIAIHQYREKFLNTEDTNNFENNMEILEGIPRYIALQSKQLSDKQYRLFSQRTDCPPIGMLTETPDSTLMCMLAGFPTYSGVIYARALDKKGPQTSWKKLTTEKFRAPSRILGDHYHFNNIQIKIMTAAAKKNPAYNYARIEKIANATMKDHLKNLHNAKQQYEKLQGVELRLDRQLGGAVFESQYLGEPNASAIYQTTLTNYLCVDVNYDGNSEDSIPLVAKNLPFIVYHVGLSEDSIEPESKDSYTALKLDDNATIVIDAVNYTPAQLINEKKVIEFSSMDINDSHLHYEQHYIGKLDASKGFLKVYTAVNSKK